MNIKSTQSRHTLEEVYYLAGFVIPEVNELRYLLAKSLTHAPANVVDQLFEECHILVREPAEQGCFIPKTLVAGKHIIMFPFDIFGWPEEQ